MRLSFNSSGVEQTHPGDRSPAVKATGCLLLEIYIREKNRKKEAVKGLSDSFPALQETLVQTAMTAGEVLIKKQASFLLGEVVFLDKTFIYNHLQGLSNPALSLETFWSDPFLVLTSMKPELRVGEPAIIGHNKQKIYEVLLKAVEGPSDENALLAGEVIAELCKTTSPEHMKPLSMLLLKLLNRNYEEDSYFDGLLGVFADISDNEVRLLDEILVSMVEKSADISKSDQIATVKKFAYLEICSNLIILCSTKLIKHIEKVKILIDSYVYSLYTSEYLKDEAWLDNEVK